MFQLKRLLCTRHHSGQSQKALGCSQTLQLPALFLIKTEPATQQSWVLWANYNKRPQCQSFNKVWKRKVAWRDVSQSDRRRGRYGSTYIESLYEICKQLGKADLHHAGVDGGGSVSVHVGLAQRLIQNGLLNHDLHSFHVHLQ